MAAALAATPASGSITSVVSAVRVDLTGGDPTVAAYIQSTDGTITLRSPAFQPSSDGKYSWFNVIFPNSGTWTTTLRKSSDDTQLATLSLTVS